MVLPETLKGRMYHTSVTIHSSPKIRIFCFGGIDAWPEDDDIDKAVPIAQTTIVELCRYVHICHYGKKRQACSIIIPYSQ